MSLHEHEFRVLRETIASRGTVRMAIVPATIPIWALTAVSLFVYGAWSIASLFPLAILLSGFEAIHALHVGVERIGRYLQVFYEGGPDGPGWETTAMRLGPGLPGGSVDPLFTTLFVTACLTNLLGVFIPPPGLVEAAVALLAHGAVVVRVIRCRRAAAHQRAADLRAFEAVRAAPPPSQGVSSPPTN